MLHTTLLIARLLLALVFAVAGVSKLADRAGSRQAVIDFGLPTLLATPVAICLPVAELAVAAALIPASTTFWGALGALALLLLITAGIGLNLARGHKPYCHCFGQIYSAPAGWRTLTRNAALLAVAGFIVWQGYDSATPSALGWLGNLSVIHLVALVVGGIVLGALTAQWWFMLNLMRQNGRLLTRLEELEEACASSPSSSNGAEACPEEGLPVGSSAPDFELPELGGERVSLSSLRSAGKPTVLIFTDPDCGSCNALLPEVGRWQREHTEELTISLVSRGESEKNRAQADEHVLTNVVLQVDSEVSEAYGVWGTPSAVLVSPDGTIGSVVAAGSEAIKSLVGRSSE